jgi:hypothetical protein
MKRIRILQIHPIESMTTRSENKDTAKPEIAICDTKHNPVLPISDKIDSFGIESKRPIFEPYHRYRNDIYGKGFTMPWSWGDDPLPIIKTKK